MNAKHVALFVVAALGGAATALVKVDAADANLWLAAVAVLGTVQGYLGLTSPKIGGGT
jgi:hypothetical protein